MDVNIMPLPDHAVLMWGQPYEVSPVPIDHEWPGRCVTGMLKAEPSFAAMIRQEM